MLQRILVTVNHSAPAMRNGAGTIPILCFVLALILPAPSPAEEGGPPTSYQFHIGAALLDFSYKEFDDDGSLLDREDGVVPGLFIGVTQTRNTWSWSGRFAFHRGDVAYDGQTSGGIPLTTRTDELFMQVAFQAARPPRGTGLAQSGYYAGFDYRRWERDIRSTESPPGTFVLGPFEVYQWWSVYAGTNAVLSDRPHGTWSIDLRLLRTINPDIRINFHGLYDNVRFDLGERFGFRLAFPWQRRLAGGDLLTVEPYLEGWKFGRSADRVLTQGGVPAGSVFEPRSETLNIGIQVGLTRPF